MNFKVIALAALWASLAVSQAAAQHGGAVSSEINAGGPAAHFGGSLAFDGTDGKKVTGKPLSATVEHRTVQILADGTRIENTETARFYRDEEGRTRIQRTDGSGVIHDPAQGIPDQVAPDGRVLHNLPFRVDGPPPSEPARQRGITTPESPVPAYEEDLGSQLVNGVLAHGSRTTKTISAGQIGNDRTLQVVSERWYSTDLQMNVKTIDTDPRYGEITWQLKDILQGAQDATLFRHPTSVHPQK